MAAARFRELPDVIRENPGSSVTGLFEHRGHTYGERTLIAPTACTCEDGNREVIDLTPLRLLFLLAVVVPSWTFSERDRHVAQVASAQPAGANRGPRHDRASFQCTSAPSPVGRGVGQCSTKSEIAVLAYDAERGIGNHSYMRVGKQGYMIGRRSGTRAQLGSPPHAARAEQGSTSLVFGDLSRGAARVT